MILLVFSQLSPELPESNKTIRKIANLMVLLERVEIHSEIYKFQVLQFSNDFTTFEPARSQTARK